MASVGIIGLGAYVPPNEMSNEDWMKLVDTSDEWITTKTGMKKRRIAFFMKPLESFIVYNPICFTVKSFIISFDPPPIAITFTSL